MAVLMSSDLCKQLVDLGLLPENCAEFVIKGRPDDILRVTYICYGDKRWSEVDWKAAAAEAAREDE